MNYKDNREKKTKLTGLFRILILKFNIQMSNNFMKERKIKNCLYFVKGEH